MWHTQDRDRSADKITSYSCWQKCKAGGSSQKHKASRSLLVSHSPHLPSSIFLKSSSGRGVLPTENLWSRQLGSHLFPNFSIDGWMDDYGLHQHQIDWQKLYLSLTENPKLSVRSLNFDLTFLWQQDPTKKNCRRHPRSVVPPPMSQRYRKETYQTKEISNMARNNEKKKLPNI